MAKIICIAQSTTTGVRTSVTSLTTQEVTDGQKVVTSSSQPGAGRQ